MIRISAQVSHHVRQIGHSLTLGSSRQQVTIDHSSVSDAPYIGVRHSICAKDVQVVIGDQTMESWRNKDIVIRMYTTIVKETFNTYLPLFSCFRISSELIDWMRGFGARPVDQTRRPNGTGWILSAYIDSSRSSCAKNSPSPCSLTNIFP